MTLLDALKYKVPLKLPNDKDFRNPENIFHLSRNEILSENWILYNQKWIEINDFNIKYKIDNYGNLYSYRLNKLLTPKITKFGYKQVTLRNKNGIAKSYLIHLLVAKYFLNHVKSDKVINHINGIKIDNYIDNLEIVTKSRNSKHAYELGLNIARFGEKHACSILSNEQVIEIKKRLRDGERSVDIAKIFNINPGVIAHIKSGNTWKKIN